MTSSPRPASSFQFSGLLFALLVAVIATTIGLVAVIGAIAGLGISAAPWLSVAFIAAAASWVAFVAALCRDQVLAAVKDLREHIDDYGDRRESDGRIDTLRDVVSQAPQPRDGRVPSRLHAAN